MRHQPSEFTDKALPPTDIYVSLLEYIEQESYQIASAEGFSEEIDYLRDSNIGDKKSLTRRSGMYNLLPYLMKKVYWELGEDWKSHVCTLMMLAHSVSLGKDDITRLVVEWCCMKLGHVGRGLAINEIRSNGFWVVWCNIIIRSMIGKCIKCRLLQGKLENRRWQT